VDSVGVESDLSVFRKSSLLYWNARELFATAACALGLNIGHPVPVLGKQEPIFP